MNNVVKLRPRDRVLVEEFKHEPAHHMTWHFWASVYEATDEEVSAALQRLKPSEVSRYHAGNMNLMVLRLEGYVDPCQLGAVLCDPVWVEGLTLSGGKIRGEACKAVDSVFMRNAERSAIESGMRRLSMVMQRLGLPEASEEIEVAAGIR